MRLALFTGAALAAAAFAPAAHAGDFDFTVEGFAAQTSADADFINDDKFDNDLSGVLTGVQLGTEYQFGEEDKGFVVGIHYGATLGDGMTSEPVRNGMYLVHHSTFDGFSYWDVSVGYDFGQLTGFVAYGQLERDTTTYQSCPEDWNAVVAGFCRGGGVPATAESREGLRAGSQDDAEALWRVGLEWELTEHVYVSGSYAQAEFAQTVTPLAVTPGQAGDRVAHPDTSFAQDVNFFSLGVGLRF